MRVESVYIITTPKRPVSTPLVYHCCTVSVIAAHLGPSRLLNRPRAQARGRDRQGVGSLARGVAGGGKPQEKARKPQRG